MILVLIRNFPFFTLILAFLIAWYIKLRFPDRNFFQELLSYLLLLPVGLAGLWAFNVHAFFPREAASYIGWAQSPFQWEIACANLGLGVSGILGFRQRYGYCLAVTLFTSCFLWGAAVGHIWQMISRLNFYPGNTRLILLSDILIPLFLWISLFKTKGHNH